MTAGQLADLTGPTTGAITGMLNRLEEAGLVRRERDPDDGRRVIVRLAPGEDKVRDIDSVFASIDRAWDELAARYDDEQLVSCWSFSGAATRCPGRNWSGCAKLQRAREESSPLRWET